MKDTRPLLPSKSLYAFTSLAAPPPFAAAGNVGGGEEEAAVRSTAADIQASCQGLVDFLLRVEQRQQQQQDQQQQEGAPDAAGDRPQQGGSGGRSPPRLGETLTAAVREMEAMDWLVPPMLQPR